MGLDDPVVREIEMYGYPKTTELSEYVATDALGNEVYTGDEIYRYNDEIYLIEALSYDAKEILDIIGAEREKA